MDFLAFEVAPILPLDLGHTERSLKFIRLLVQWRVNCVGDTRICSLANGLNQGRSRNPVIKQWYTANSWLLSLL